MCVAANCKDARKGIGQHAAHVERKMKLTGCNYEEIGSRRNIVMTVAVAVAALVGALMVEGVRHSKPLARREQEQEQAREKLHGRRMLRHIANGVQRDSHQLTRHSAEHKGACKCAGDDTRILQVIVRELLLVRGNRNGATAVTLIVIAAAVDVDGARYCYERAKRWHEAVIENIVRRLEIEGLFHLAVWTRYQTCNAGSKKKRLAKPSLVVYHRHHGDG